MQRTTTIGLALLLVGFVPTASAHECEAYNGCDEDACVTGEDHHHVNKNYWAREEACRSTKDGAPYEPCFVADKEFPDAICESLLPIEVASE